jgi:hypothetical protein
MWVDGAQLSIIDVHTAKERTIKVNTIWVDVVQISSIEAPELYRVQKPRLETAEWWGHVTCGFSRWGRED